MARARAYVELPTIQALCVQLQDIRESKKHSDPDLHKAEHIVFTQEVARYRRMMAEQYPGSIDPTPPPETPAKGGSASETDSEGDDASFPFGVESPRTPSAMTPSATPAFEQQSRTLGDSLSMSMGVQPPLPTLEGSYLDLLLYRLDGTAEIRRVPYVATYMEVHQRFAVVYPYHDARCVVETRDGAIIDPQMPGWRPGDLVVFREYAPPPARGGEKDRPPFRALTGGVHVARADPIEHEREMENLLQGLSVFQRSEEIGRAVFPSPARMQKRVGY